MHDRRIDGQPVTFGNASSLYKRAMTWWDHDTQSIWSQPWGRAIQGELKGVELFLLPSQISTWAAWREQHPDTLVLLNDINLMANLRQEFDPDFVIGVTLGSHAKAYPFTAAARAGVINDTLGDVPVLIVANETSYHTYVRDIGAQTLTFSRQGDTLVDNETGSTWNAARGLATDGPLRGQVLQALPSMSAYDDHWLDFYPHATIWQAAK